MLSYLPLFAFAVSSAAPPHIVFNLVDDWGWADVGFHRPTDFNETVTPNIDALVASGVKLDQHYVHKYCSPSRSTLQSGRLPIHVNVVNAIQQVWNPADPVSGFAAIPRNMTGIATKMSQGGYATHMAGKWDAGMATPDHTPFGRGYDTSLNYFQHANDYWTQIDARCMNATTNKSISIVDLWDTNTDGRKYNNSWNCSQDNQMPSCIYEDEIFVERVLSTIQAHDPSTPLFLFWAPHIVHAPLEVPQAYLDKFAWISDSPRRSYMAMVNYLDGLVGRVVDALKAKGMWDNLLWVSSADNGGPIYTNGTAGANNYPLRGGKMSNWQGGIRTNAYASGGAIPAAVRNTTVSGLISLADWYATFAEIAGVPVFDDRAAAAGLPPVDGLNVWPLISGANLTSPRTEVPIGSVGEETNLGNGTQVQALIRADGYKLIIGMLGQNIWTGPLYPNASTNWNDVPYHCGVPSDPPAGKGGCLFNIFDDPTEHNDIAQENPAIVQELYARIVEIQKSSFSPDRGTDDGTSCRVAIDKWDGFFGPFLP